MLVIYKINISTDMNIFQVSAYLISLSGATTKF